MIYVRVKGSMIYTHCDNIGTYYISIADGISFEKIWYEPHWPTLTQMDVIYVTSDSILGFECADDGVVGGFTSTNDFNGNKYSTTETCGIVEEIQQMGWNLVNAEWHSFIVMRCELQVP